MGWPLPGSLCLWDTKGSRCKIVLSMCSCVRFMHDQTLCSFYHYHTVICSPVTRCRYLQAVLATSLHDILRSADATLYLTASPNPSLIPLCGQTRLPQHAREPCLVCSDSHPFYNHTMLTSYSPTYRGRINARCAGYVNLPSRTAGYQSAETAK